MRVKIRNIGVIKQAEFSLGDLTIICGGNNTGKTYATYALFGFLSIWRHMLEIKIGNNLIQTLISEGNAEISLENQISKSKNILKNGCKTYSESLFQIFASSEKKFLNSHFEIDLSEELLLSKPEFESIKGSAKSPLIYIQKKEDSLKINISLLVEKDNIKIPEQLIRHIVGDALKEILFAHIFPRPFIASAERTGAAIFRRELNFARNRLLEEMGSREKDIDPFELLSKVYTDYALPVKSNVDFTRQLEVLFKQESYISKKHPEILNDFADIIGGEYLVTKNDELYYIPKGKKIKLTMDESSSSVRSLLDIGFYLKHVAHPGDLLIIDEPELNLHPENQRRVARLIARVINAGIKVFITTHSDYIIKELNTLIMLNQEDERLKQMAKNEGYRDSELLNADQLKVYVAEDALIKLDGAQRKTKCQTLVEADIDPKLGIEAKSFDTTIEDMNRIQDEIVWGA
jgi:hypothetical protein